MIVHYERKPNIVSDAELGKNAVASNLKGVKILASDRAFYSKKMALAAEDNDLILSFSALTASLLLQIKSAPTSSQLMRRKNSFFPVPKVLDR